MNNLHLRYIAQFLFVFYLFGVQATGPGLSWCLPVGTNAHFARIADACSLSAGVNLCTTGNSCTSAFLGEPGNADHHETKCHHFPITPDHQRSSFTQHNPPSKGGSLTGVIPSFISPTLHLLTSRDFDLACLNRTCLPPVQSLSALRTIVIRC